MRIKPLFLAMLPGLLAACAPSSPSPSLQAALGQPALSFTRSEGGNLTLTLTPQGGFTATVELVLEKQDGSPAPAGLSLSPTSVAVSGSNPVSVDLSLASTASTPTGTHPLRIRASGGSLGAACSSHCASLSLFVGAKGELDPSFDTDGLLTQDMSSTIDEAHAIVVQPDGKVVVAGFGVSISNPDIVVARYNPDGSLDTSFGSGGTAITDVSGSTDEAYTMVLQPDGKLVVAGTAYNAGNFDFALVRYNANGSLDTSFGSSGKIMTGVGSSTDLAYALVLQPDGKLIAAGYSSNGSNRDFALVRYNANGSLDTSFGSGGKVITAVGSSDDQINSIVLQPDGKLVAAGYSRNTNNDFALVRYNPDGSLDTTFGSSGKVITAVGSGNDSASALVRQPDGKLVAAGISSNDFALVRYNPDGSLDTTFGSGGQVVTPVGTSLARANALGLQPDGKLVAAGYSYNDSNYDFALARYY